MLTHYDGPVTRATPLPPDEAANALRAMTFALTHPIVNNGRQPRPEQIVDLVLHGITSEAEC